MTVLTVSRLEEKATATISVTGELDIAARPLLLARSRAVLSGGPGHLVIDVSGLTFVDAAGLGALVAVQRRADRQATVVQLTGVPPHMLWVMDLTQSRGHFRIAP
jgi:anti-sigma B factor antagonist